MTIAASMVGAPGRGAASGAWRVRNGEAERRPLLTKKGVAKPIR
jgi:hypothetical protein